jgi:hypothetical protein
MELEENNRIIKLGTILSFGVVRDPRNHNGRTIISQCTASTNYSWYAFKMTIDEITMILQYVYLLVIREIYLGWISHSLFAFLL